MCLAVCFCIHEGLNVRSLCGHNNVTLIIVQVNIMTAIEFDLTFNSDFIVVFHEVYKVLGIFC